MSLSDISDIAGMMKCAAALTTHKYSERLQDASFGHVMTNPSTPDSPLFVPYYLRAHASTSGHQRPSSPPPPTIDPSVLRRPPSSLILSKQDARSVVKDYVGSAGWLSSDTKEPKVGDGGVPSCASQLAEDGSSIFRCFIDEVKQQRVTKYKCGDCNHTVDRIDRALEHQRSKRGHKPFSCPKRCPFKAPSIEAIATHLKSSPHKAAVNCPNCTKSVSERNLTRHMNTHIPKQQRRKPRRKRASAKRRL